MFNWSECCECVVNLNWTNLYSLSTCLYFAGTTPTGTVNFVILFLLRRIKNQFQCVTLQKINYMSHNKLIKISYFFLLSTSHEFFLNKNFFCIWCVNRFNGIQPKWYHYADLQFFVLIWFEATVSLYLPPNKKLVTQGFTNRFMQKATTLLELSSELEFFSNPKCFFSTIL